MTKRRTALRALLAIAALWAAVAAPADGPNIGLIYAAPKFVKLQEKGKDDQRPYRDAVEDNGGMVVVVSQTYAPERVDALLPGLDGVLLPGGIDVDPEHYGEERHEKLEKTDAALDRLEFKVLDHAKARGLPVLGVCRGHQVLNVYFGGTLVQDIPSECHCPCTVVHRYSALSKEKKEHPITIEKGSLLQELFGTERLVVNTYHHQAVRDLAPGFVIAARTDDSVVEAIEGTAAPFILGVQFHPEKLRPKDPRFNAPFRRLVEEARKAQQARENATGDD